MYLWWSSTMVHIVGTEPKICNQKIDFLQALQECRFFQSITEISKIGSDKFVYGSSTTKKFPALLSLKCILIGNEIHWRLWNFHKSTRNQATNRLIKPWCMTFLCLQIYPYHIRTHASTRCSRFSSPSATQYNFQCNVQWNSYHCRQKRYRAGT